MINGFFCFVEMAYNPNVNVDPQLAQFFAAVDTDRSGRINAIELQAVLQSSNGRKFAETACRLMICKYYYLHI